MTACLFLFSPLATADEASIANLKQELEVARQKAAEAEAAFKALATGAVPNPAIADPKNFENGTHALMGPALDAKLAREAVEKKAAELKAAEMRAAWEANGNAQALLRDLAADYMDILAMPRDKQVQALRDFAAKHKTLILDLSKAKSPGRAILDARMMGSPVDWTPEMDEKFVSTIDQMFNNPRFKKLVWLSPLGGDLFQFIPSDKLQWVIDQSAEKLQDIRVSDQPGFKRILDPNGGVKISNPDVKRLAEEMLPKFYDNLPVRIKANIVASVLRLPPDASFTRQASEVLQSSGPVAQKLFQLIGRESSSEEMTAVMEELQANIRPIPREKIVAVIEKRMGKKLEEVFSEFSEPIHSGTVGQIHFAKLKSTGQEVVVKVRRPGVVEDFLSELEALKIATKGTNNAQIVPKVESSIGKELNFLLEAINLKEGRVYINDAKGIGIADLIDGFPPYEDMLVEHKAPGMKINKFVRSTDLLARGEAMNNLLEAWVRNSVFDDGFFHGDLHPGNVYFDLRGEKKLPFWQRWFRKPKYDYDLTLIDFGNAGRITLEQQRGFIRMLAAITLRSPGDVMKAIETIGKVPDGAREAILADIANALDKPPTYPLSQWYQGVFSDILETCLKNKVDMPDSFLAFNRGKAFLEIELHEVNKLLDKVDPKQKLKRFDPMRTMMKAFIKQVPSVPLSLVKASERETSVLTFEMMWEIATMWKGSLYQTPAQFCQTLYRAIRPAKK